MADIEDREFLIYPNDKNNDNQRRTIERDYRQIALAKLVGAVDWCVDFQEFANDDAGTNDFEIAGRDFSNAGEGRTEYWLSTQEGIRDKAAAMIELYLEWDGSQVKSNDFAGIKGGLTNGIQFFWDRTFRVEVAPGVKIPVIQNLFTTTPPILTTRDLYRFTGMGANVDNKSTTAPAVTSLWAKYTFRNPPRLINLEGAGYVSDRLGVILNDDFDSALTGALNTFTVRITGDSLFIKRSLI